MKKLLLLFTIFLVSVSMGSAQKYGHLNFGTVLSAMPETKAADKTLEDYQKQLVAKGEKMAGDFQKKVTDYYEKVQSGELTPKAQEDIANALQKEQMDIQAYEQEVSQKIQEKRNELLKPIIEKAQNAINAVAKDQGYIMIFDSSVFNAILFAGEAEDIMVFVAAKLGLN